jgi:dolichyl-phosphate-mannose--protein O-mannosyl transferase
LRVVANKEATEPRVPFGKVEVITSKSLQEQTTQWPIEKVQKDKQRSTKHTYKTKDQVTRTPLKARDAAKW